MNSLEGMAAVLTDLDQELDKASGLYAEVAAISQRLGNPWGLPEVALGLANIALRQDRFDIAAFLLGVAESLAQPIGLSLEYFPRQQWRRALDAARDGLDSETVVAAPGRGRAVAADAALETLRAVAAELAAVTRQHGSAGAESSPLTPREREVLALVARGQSNQQIADALFVSRGTARTHVANILAKLEVHSRADAVAAAERLGITATPPSTYGT
jgi:DNA-binding CsgD family transcriptional regulator